MDSSVLMRELQSACAAAIEVTQEARFQSFDRSFTVGMGDEVARGNVYLTRNPTTQWFFAVITITLDHRNHVQQSSSPSPNEAIEIAHKETHAQFFEGPRPSRVGNLSEEAPRAIKGMAREGYAPIRRESE